MSKHIFKNIDIKDLGKPVFITPLDYVSLERIKKTALQKKDKDHHEGDHVSSSIEITYGLKKKQEEFEQEMAQKQQEFEAKTKEIQENAENWAFEKIQEADKKYEARIKLAEELAEQKVNEATEEAARIVNEAQAQAKKLQDEANKSGHDEGYELGYQEGKEELERLIGRLNIIVSSAVKKRNLILEEAESQLVALVITIARKVVKSITEEQKRVVYDNIVAALKMLRGQTEVTIRVNIEDLQMTTRHKKEFIEMVESIDHVKILEDNMVDKGGCIITSEFGSIDARIMTQLSNIEEQIKRLVPIVEVE